MIRGIVALLPQGESNIMDRLTRSDVGRHRVRVAVAAATMLAVLVPAVAIDASPVRSTVSAAARPASPSRHSGPFAVGVRTVTFVDPSRPTPASNGVPAKPSRTLVTTIFYPARGPAGGPDIRDAPAAVHQGRFPLIVFSHGFTASGPAYGPIVRRFTQAGYVVAAPTFPLSSGGAPGGPAIGDYVNQPGDVSFVIDRMLRLDRDRHSGLTHLLSRHRIGVAGHSLGAITTLGLLNTCCIDRRIDAAVSISGIELPFPGGSFTYQRRTPLLLLHGDADGTVPYVGSTNAYAHAGAPKFLVTLLGASHVPFFGAPGEVIVHSMTDFFDRYLKHRRGSLNRLLVDSQVPSVSKLNVALR